VVTGEPEYSPALDGIPTFTLIERDGKWFVQVPKEGLLPKKVAMPLTKRDPEDKRHFVIVGGGPAGLNCAETLRQSGFTGQISVYGKEEVVPYDRTLLSKMVATGNPDNWALRPDDYLKDADIDYKLGGKGAVFSINTEKRKIITHNGDHVEYDKLLIATGSELFYPPVEGLGTNAREVPKKVSFLRTAKDMKSIQEAAKTAKRVVIVGASFIGTEVASSLIAKYKDMDLHMVCDTAVPFEHILGKEIGAMYLAEHEAAGVKVHTHTMVKKINVSSENEMESLEFKDGTVLEADLVIMATGVTPATKILEGSSIEMGPRGSVVVDPFLQTSAKDVYAAGDLALYPYWPTGG